MLVKDSERRGGDSFPVLKSYRHVVNRDMYVCFSNVELKGQTYTCNNCVYSNEACFYLMMCVHINHL